MCLCNRKAVTQLQSQMSIKQEQNGDLSHTDDQKTQSLTGFKVP